MDLRDKMDLMRKGMRLGASWPSGALADRVGDGTTLYKQRTDAELPKATGNRAQRRAQVAAGKARP